MVTQEKVKQIVFVDDRVKTLCRVAWCFVEVPHEQNFSTSSMTWCNENVKVSDEALSWIWF
jgi:hypothetical protein